MADIRYSFEDAVRELVRIKEDTLNRVEQECNRVVAQLREVQVARKQLDELSLQLNAAAIGVVSVTVYQHQKLSGFSIDDHQGGHSEFCNLIRPLKFGRYRAIVIFTEDAPPEDHSENPRR